MDYYQDALAFDQDIINSQFDKYKENFSNYSIGRSREVDNANINSELEQLMKKHYNDKEIKNQETVSRNKSEVHCASCMKKSTKDSFQNAENTDNPSDFEIIKQLVKKNKKFLLFVVVVFVIVCYLQNQQTNRETMTSLQNKISQLETQLQNVAIPTSNNIAVLP